MSSAEQWDVHWYRIYHDARGAGETEANAAVLADHECLEQFGPRPEEVA
ncbi:MAG TPA: hypothetical protein VGX25_06750 [Actinophytocola sp.]|nr:hypothetical protein [Actinophytocola sp.]HEV2779087.1 hypothetical protein [Actinophytocola sp.]